MTSRRPSPILLNYKHGSYVLYAQIYGGISSGSLRLALEGKNGRFLFLETNKVWVGKHQFTSSHFSRLNNYELSAPDNVFVVFIYRLGELIARIGFGLFHPLDYWAVPRVFHRTSFWAAFRAF